MPTGVYERTPETREILRRANLRPETREKIGRVHRGKKVSPETREKQRQATLKYWANHPEHREKVRQTTIRQMASPKAREKCRQARLRQTLPKKMTSIERLLRDEFKKRRLKFDMHKVVFGRFQPDFVFESARLIVQADGDYWHGPASVNRKRDAAFNKAAHDEGWSVWRFGGKEIEMNPAACARAVARFVRDH